MPRGSELPFVSSGPLQGPELVTVTQGGVTSQTTAQDIANLASPGGLVDSVNGQTGVVVLDAADVGATPDPSLLSGVSGLNGAEILTVEQGGVPIQATTQQIANLAAGGSGSPGGSNGQVQYNDASAFGGEPGFTYDETDNRLDVPRLNLGPVDGDLNSLAGDDDHWLQISNDPSVVAGLGSAGKQLLRVNSYGSAGYGGNLHFCRYRGTAASPTAVQSGDTFMSFGMRGWDSSAVLSQSAASFAAVATENWTSTAHGIKYVWQVTPNGSTTRGNGMELTSDGLAVTGRLVSSVLALSDGANIAVNAAGGNSFRVTLGGNRTLDNPSNLVDGQFLFFRVKQDGTGSRTLAYGSKYKFPGGAPTLSTAAAAQDAIACQYDATDDTLYCTLSKAFA